MVAGGESGLGKTQMDKQYAGAVPFIWHGAYHSPCGDIHCVEWDFKKDSGGPFPKVGRAYFTADKEISGRF